jgi:hypothetical protein
MFLSVAGAFLTKSTPPSTGGLAALITTYWDIDACKWSRGVHTARTNGCAHGAPIPAGCSRTFVVCDKPGATMIQTERSDADVSPRRLAEREPMDKQKSKLDELPDADQEAIKKDSAAYQKNEKATEKNREKDNKPQTRFDNPDSIRKNEEPRNDGDKGGNSD